MLSFIHVQEGLRMFRRSLTVRKHGLQHYKGNAKQICEQIVRDCWNGRYFQVSNGNFPEFWTRDFGWCCADLLKLGYKKEVISTLRYALERFESAGRITTTINPKGISFDFPNYAPDSLAFFMRSLRLAKAKELVESYKGFLSQEIEKFFFEVIDEETGLVKNKSFSSMQDLAKRKSACYDNVMAAMLKEDINALRIENPFRRYNFRKLLMENFWNGEYFLDDLGNRRYVAADANVLPFWCGIITSKRIMKSSVRAIQREKLDKPFPVRYNNKHSKMIFVERLAKGYQTSSVWTHLGLMFIEVTANIYKERAREYLNQYRRVIKKYGNYLEVFNQKGKPFHSLLYYCDEGMLWAAMYADLEETLT